jgi:hypothetical protein
VHRAIDLDKEAIEIRVEPPAATRAIEPKRLPSWWGQSSQPGKMPEVDLGKRVRTPFDVAEYACEQSVMLGPTRRNQFRTQPLGGRQPLLDRSTHDGARFSGRRHPGRGVDDGSLDPDGREVPSRMDIGSREASRQMNPHPGQLMPAGVVPDEHVHEAVIEAGEPELLSTSDACKCTVVLREYGHPALLPGGEWAVVENNKLAAARLPAPRVDLGSDRIEVVPMVAELMAGDDPVLQLGETVERRSGR